MKSPPYTSSGPPGLVTPAAADPQPPTPYPRQEFLAAVGAQGVLPQQSWPQAPQYHANCADSPTSRLQPGAGSSRPGQAVLCLPACGVCGVCPSCRSMRSSAATGADESSALPPWARQGEAGLKRTCDAQQGYAPLQHKVRGFGLLQDIAITNIV